MIRPNVPISTSDRGRGSTPRHTRKIESVEVGGSGQDGGKAGRDGLAGYVQRCDLTEITKKFATRFELCSMNVKMPVVF